MRDKHVIAFCKSENILLQEFPNNGVVRRLKDRDDWSSIWKKRISQKVFTSQVLTEILIVPKELGEISKNTKRLLQEKVSSLQHIQK